MLPYFSGLARDRERAISAYERGLKLCKTAEVPPNFYPNHEKSNFYAVFCGDYILRCSFFFLYSIT
jgi:hypothetical protein